ncbi:hypothetical protein [uncultured Winogradskyella sp.]|uniref:hypothetical protein n=1 Tax=uncultured Winogradskyella sp. TaxID=395353 RepID=UPI0030DD7028|tara:strand:- start:5185 stop:5889 length:705 start_codon:yes stop_codon:yes gene_type:complete
MTTFDFLFHLLELGAALSASFYWLKTKENAIRPFVWYLWFIVFIETLAMYPFLYEILDNSIINNIKNSQFYRNTWLYNTYDPIVVFLIGKFMISNTNTLFSHRIIKSLVLGFIIFWLVYFLFVANYFEAVLPYDFVISTFVIFIMVMLYLRELLKSNELMNFYKSPVFYVIIALMLWYICLTPLFIFNAFHLKVNEEFLSFRKIFLNTSNIILYSWYIFAFLYPLRFQKKLIPR